jgi:uncharacterized membrane protein YidH (DUF202 family)
MGAVLFFSLGIALFLSIPYITSQLAKRNGRNPKIWFFIGIVLPVVATIILVLLPEKTTK